MSTYVYHVVYSANGEVRDVTVGRSSAITTSDDTEAIKGFIRARIGLHPAEPVALINWILVEVKE